MKSSGTWTLYRGDRTSTFHRYVDLDAATNIGRLPAEIDTGPTCVFSG